MHRSALLLVDAGAPSGARIRATTYSYYYAPRTGPI